MLLPLMKSNQTLNRYLTSYLTGTELRFEPGANCSLIDNILPLLVEFGRLKPKFMDWLREIVVLFQIV